MELWSDLIPPLLEKYAQLHAARLQHRPADEATAHILRRYDAMCFEMVEGIHTLFIEMIRNQGYVRKAFPKLEFDIYREAHLGMIESLKESISEDVQTLNEFAFRLQGLIQQLRGYCAVLRQDIKRAIFVQPALQKDRKFRQINLQAQQAMVAIDLHLARSKQLSEEIARGQFEKAVDGLGEWEANAEEMRSLLAELHFTEEEKQILRQLTIDN